VQDYLTTIEELSKSVDLHKGKIKKFTKEILIHSSESLMCDRCNVWLFEKEQTELMSLLSYTRSDHSFSKEVSLDNETLPNYFRFLRKNEFIVSNNARSEPMNSELLDGYIIPNQITSMIDVPLRSEGKMIGVICFEHIEKNHSWSSDEQKFTQSMAQLLSLALETNKKRKYRKRLEKIIKQKEVLITEINHRVKNNMAVIISLLNLQKSKTGDTYHSGLLEEVKSKVYSMSMIQEQLHSNRNIDSIDLAQYLQSLVTNLNDSYGQGKNVQFNLEMESIGVDVSNAIPCGLIANEILTNSFKYAFNGLNQNPELGIKLEKQEGFAHLEFYDNGTGFDLTTSNTGMGLELIKDLSEQIGATISFSTKVGVSIKLVIPID
jgi:two-component sensor histidine kinase